MLGAMKVLGIETSCDETAASVVEDGRNLLSNAVASSMDLHVAYGGVVPEIAARSHLEVINSVVDKALRDARKASQGFSLDEVQGAGEQRTEPYMKYGEGAAESATLQFAKSAQGKLGSARLGQSASDDLWDSIDAIAVTYGPGLGGSLLIGVMTARTLAIAKHKPLYAVNHVQAHAHANFLTNTSLPGYQLPSQQPEFPMLALLVSGKHSEHILFRSYFDYTLLGQTQDDAIGEAFDKVAKMLGLPYPGGPSVGKKALEGDPLKYELPKAHMGKYDFSFSGLKTAVLRLAQAEIGEDFTFPSKDLPGRLSERQKADIAASFQHVAIETLVDKTITAYEEFAPKSVVIGGGVAASAELRRQLAERLPHPIEYPDMKLCTDNGAMVATLGCLMAMYDQPTTDPYVLDINPSLSM